MSCKFIGGIMGEDGAVRQPQGETERVNFAVFMELTRQQLAYGEKPLISFRNGGIFVQVNIPELMAAIARELDL